MIATVQLFLVLFKLSPVQHVSLFKFLQSSKFIKFVWQLLVRQCLLSTADPSDLEREISAPKTGLLQQFECILESDVNELCGFILRSRFLLTLVRFNFLAYRANKTRIRLPRIWMSTAQCAALQVFTCLSVVQNWFCPYLNAVKVVWSFDLVIAQTFIHCGCYWEVYFEN